MTAFALTSDRRAREAAKDLLAILKDHGIKSSLKKCQETVASMLGYLGWQDLLDNLGEVADPEDGSADAETVEERHGIQRRALLAAGVAQDLVEGVRAAVSVTARSGSENLKPVGSIDGVDQYHPHRYADAVVGKYRYDEGVARLNGRNVEEPEEGAYGFFLELAKFYNSMLNYSNHRPVFSRDVALINAAEDGDRIWGPSREVLASSTIIDASRMPLEGIAYPGKAFDFGLLKGKTHYVHIGPNAFPSPYFRGGIEGVYVDPSFFDEIDDEEDVPREVAFGLVVSPEYITSLHWMDQTTDMFDPYRWLIENSRVAWLTALVNKDGVLGDLTPMDDAETYEDFVVCGAPVAAIAVEALAKRFAAVPEMVECLSVECTEEEVARFRRARTPEQRKRVLEEMAQFEGDTGVIVSWGGTPARVDTVPAPAAYLRQEPDDLMETIRVYAHCAEHERAWRQVHFSTLAGEMIEKLRSSEHEDADRAESWAWVNRLCLANGHSDLREYPQALEALRPIIGQHEHFFALNAIVPAMAAAILAEDKEAVAALVKDADKLQILYLGMHRCDRAMWAAFMGRIYLGEDVRQDVEDVVESNSLVVDSLETSRGYFEPRSLHAPGTEKSAIAIASGFSDVWARYQAAGIAPLLEAGHKPVIH